ncbi:DctP family TRAP transporter solute-binding subunit [Lysinibacillus sp. KU-BSD001]|uniref:DctP family TRAP transporter solute-binding subunit n=1 Tax=Lysinibacillus sp. KU-BSD001 TaxID=3141328 RepID=UPI0036E790FD
MKLKKRKWALIPTLALSVLLAACGGDEKEKSATDTGEEEYNLKMSVTVADTTAWFAGAQKLADDIEAETDGRITIDVFANEQLSGGDSAKAVEGLAKGSIDLTFNSTIIYSILDERFGVVSAPFLFNSLDDVDAAFAGDGGELLSDILLEKNVVALGFGENGFRQVTNNKGPIASPADFKGMKMRIPGITMYTDLFRGYGADPATMTWSEVFTALQQGTIDGQENPIDVIYSSKIDEVQDYLTLWNYSYDPLVLGINKDLYESMSKEDQELFDRLGKEAAAYQVQLNRERSAEQLEELKEKGMEVNELTDEQLQAFKDASQAVYDKYTAIWGEDLLKAFQAE